MSEVIDIKAREQGAVTAALFEQHIKDCTDRYKESAWQMGEIQTKIDDGFKLLHGRVTGAISSTSAWRLKLSYGVIAVLLAILGAVAMAGLPWK